MFQLKKNQSLNSKKFSRRELLNKGAKLSLLTAGTLLLSQMSYLSRAMAEKAKSLIPKDFKLAKPSEPTPKALQYVEVASKAAARTDKKAFCHNCALYGVKGADKVKEFKHPKHGPVNACGMFGGEYVKSNGWCMGWNKKS